MCVSKIKEIHARVTELCSGNEMRTSGRGPDGRPDGRTFEATPIPPPPLRRAGDKNSWNILKMAPTASFLVILEIGLLQYTRRPQ